MKKFLQKLKQPHIAQPILIGLVVLATIVGYVLYQSFVGRVFIDNSLVEAPITTIAPATPGILSKVFVYEGERIQKGDSLAIVGGQTLYAQTDGLIIATDKSLGSLVNAQTPVVQLINPVSMRIAGTIDENKGLSSIHVGQVVSFTVDAYPGQTFWGYVDEVSPSAKSTQNAFSISSERPTQQFIVYATFDSKKYPFIKNGMSAKMTVFTNTREK